MENQSVGKIYKQICLVMGDINPISKDKKNTMQNYSFRGIDDVYNELSKSLSKHGVFTVPEVLNERTEERQTAKGGTLIYRVLRIRFTFYADDGSSVYAVVIGEGMDSGDKASNKAMSVAHKYALIQVFAIPTAEPKDPEHQSYELKPKTISNEEYQALPEQKIELANIAASYGLDKSNRIALKELSDHMLGVPMLSLTTKVKAYIDNPMDGVK